MRGSSTSATGIYVGQTQQQGRGKQVVVDATVNAKKMKPEYCSVIIAMLATT